MAGAPLLAVPVPAALPSSSAHQLQRLASTHARYLRHTSGPSGRGRPHARLLSNKTYYSPAEPDARISVKPGKARALNYLCSLAVDEGRGVISHVQADFADYNKETDCFTCPPGASPAAEPAGATDAPVAATHD